MLPDTPVSQNPTEKPAEKLMQLKIAPDLRDIDYRPADRGEGSQSTGGRYSNAARLLHGRIEARCQSHHAFGKIEGWRVRRGLYAVSTSQELLDVFGFR